MRKPFLRISICISLLAATACNPAGASDKIIDIKSVTSANGLTAWVVEDHTLPIIAVELCFLGAGAAVDTEDKQGLAQLASNTLDEGAGTLDSQAFQKTLTDNSITLRFTSSRDDFCASIKTLTRHKDLALDLLRLALTEPRFDEEPVNRMRASNLTRIRSNMTDPEWMAARLVNDIAYKGHPYAFNSGGTLTTMSALTPEDLRGFVKNRLARNNLRIGIAGDMTAQDAKIMIDSVFGKLPEVANLPLIPDITVQNGGDIVLYKKDMPQTIIEIMQPGIDHKDPEWPAAQVMNYIYGGSGFGSRLMDEVREKRGLTYGIYSNYTMMDHVKSMSISTSTENKNAADVIKIIRDEMTRIKTDPVSDKDLADAKSYIIGSVPLGLSSTSHLAAAALSLQKDNFPIDYLDTMKERINAVTTQDIQKAANRILSPEKLTIIMVGQPADITPTHLVDTLPHVE